MLAPGGGLLVRGPHIRTAALGLTLVIVAAACATSTTSTPPAASSPTGTAGAGTAGSCTPANFPKGEVSITAWTGTDTTARTLMAELVAQYQVLHPNVKIDNQPTGTTDGFNKMLVAIPAGVGQPTLATFFEPFLETFIKPGYLDVANPEAVCAKSQQDIIDRYIPGSIDPMVRNGTVYALPVQRNAWSLLINNDKFTAAGLKLSADIPKTWDQLAALKDKLTKKDASGKVTQKSFEMRYTAGDQWFSMPFIGMIYQQGGDILDASGKAVLTSPEAVKALQNWAANVVEPSVTRNTGPSPYQDFADELDVISFGGPNALSFVETLNPSLKGRVTVASLPAAGAKFSGGMSYGFHYGVNKNATAEQKYVAWNFINFFLSDPNLWWQRTGQLQPKKDWFNLPAAKASTGLDVFVNDLANSRALPRTTQWGALQDAIKNAIQRVVLNKADPKASLDQAQREYDAAAK